MRKMILVAAFALIFAGCLTQRSQFPVAAAVTPPQGAETLPVIGLARTQDDRPNEKAGHIGGLRITAGNDALDYVHDSLKNKLMQKGFRVVEVTDPSKAADPHERPAERTISIIPILQSASITTADAILFAATIDVDLAAKVYDAKGEVVYATKARSEQKNRLWFSSGTKKTGRLLSEAVDAVLDQVLADPKFATALGASRD